jgi:hypothetical protein
MKVSQRPGAADRGAWPIAAPLERVAKLLRVDLAVVTEAAERVAPTSRPTAGGCGVVTEAAERVAPYITADGRSLWSVKLIERAIDPDARPWLYWRSAQRPKTLPTLAG